MSGVFGVYHFPLFILNLPILRINLIEQLALIWKSEIIPYFRKYEMHSKPYLRMVSKYLL